MDVALGWDAEDQQFPSLSSTSWLILGTVWFPSFLPSGHDPQFLFAKDHVVMYWSFANSRRHENICPKD